MILPVTAFQNAPLSSETASNACSSVTFGKSTLMLRDTNDGSKITLNPASCPIVLNTTRASVGPIFKLIGDRDSGFNSGGADINPVSSGGATPTALGASSCFTLASKSAAFWASCCATALDGSIASAF